ncbi:hypothetical protein PIB30_036707 [Stylosanthes scabra]|uniref:Uncharacterized protein n=1 Tax=Stylosanthes scabra TaxID=79078 RepID=A0ABU6ZBU3_9FABA|nr:hypothetical protein [Stylosanthes scabra]
MSMEESMLVDARHEIDVLVTLKILRMTLRTSEPNTEDEASASREEEAQLKENLKEVEAEAINLQEALKETKAEKIESPKLENGNGKLKEDYASKENDDSVEVEHKMWRAASSIVSILDFRDSTFCVILRLSSRFNRKNLLSFVTAGATRLGELCPILGLGEVLVVIDIGGGGGFQNSESGNNGGESAIASKKVKMKLMGGMVVVGMGDGNGFG